MCKYVQLTRVARVEEVAKKRGISMAQVSIAWILSKDGDEHYK